MHHGRVQLARRRLPDADRVVALAEAHERAGGIERTNVHLGGEPCVRHGFLRVAYVNDALHPNREAPVRAESAEG